MVASTKLHSCHSNAHPHKRYDPKGTDNTGFLPGAPICPRLKNPTVETLDVIQIKTSFDVERTSNHKIYDAMAYCTNKTMFVLK
jgi:hypothetical protein